MNSTMKKTTKAEAKAQKAEWAKALVEGRVVRFNDGLTLKAYPTIEARDLALAAFAAAGMDAEIVEVAQ